MKKLLSIATFSVLLFSCAKEGSKTSQNVPGIAVPNTSSGEGCSLSQGYWFASPAAQWPADGVTVGGFQYSESEAKAIWNTSNQLGLPDSKKAFTQLVAIKLSAATIGVNASVWSDVAIAENYLSGLGKLTPSYLPTGNSDAANSAGSIGNWINANHCN